MKKLILLLLVCSLLISSALAQEVSSPEQFNSLPPDEQVKNLYNLYQASDAQFLVLADNFFANPNNVQTFFSDGENLGRNLEIAENYFKESDTWKENIDSYRDAAQNFFEKRHGINFAFDVAREFSYDGERITNHGKILLLESYLEKVEVIEQGICFVPKGGQRSCLSGEEVTEISHLSVSGKDQFTFYIAEKETVINLDDQSFFQWDGEELVIEGAVIGDLELGDEKLTYTNHQGQLIFRKDGSFQADNAQVIKKDLIFDGKGEYNAQTREVTLSDHGASSQGNLRARNSLFIDRTTSVGVTSQGQVGEGQDVVKIHLTDYPATVGDKKKDDKKVKGLTAEERALAAGLVPAKEPSQFSGEVWLTRNQNGQVTVTAKGKVDVGFYKGNTIVLDKPYFHGRDATANLDLVSNGETVVKLAGNADYNDGQYGKLSFLEDQIVVREPGIQTFADGAISLSRKEGQQIDTIFAHCFGSCPEGAAKVNKNVGVGTLSSLAVKRQTIKIGVNSENKIDLVTSNLGGLGEEGQGNALLVDQFVDLQTFSGDSENQVLRVGSSKEGAEGLFILKETQTLDKTGEVVDVKEEVVNFNARQIFGKKVVLVDDNKAARVDALLKTVLAKDFSGLSKFAEEAWSDDLRGQLVRELGIDPTALDNGDYIAGLQKLSSLQEEKEQFIATLEKRVGFDVTDGLIPISCVGRSVDASLCGQQLERLRKTKTKIEAASYARSAAEQRNLEAELVKLELEQISSGKDLTNERLKVQEDLSKVKRVRSGLLKHAEKVKLAKQPQTTNERREKLEEEQAAYLEKENALLDLQEVVNNLQDGKTAEFEGKSVSPKDLSKLQNRLDRSYEELETLNSRVLELEAVEKEAEQRKKEYLAEISSVGSFEERARRGLIANAGKLQELEAAYYKTIGVDVIGKEADFLDALGAIWDFGESEVPYVDVQGERYYLGTRADKKRLLALLQNKIDAVRSQNARIKDEILLSRSQGQGYALDFYAEGRKDVAAELAISSGDTAFARDIALEIGENEPDVANSIIVKASLADGDLGVAKFHADLLPEESDLRLEAEREIGKTLTKLFEQKLESAKRNREVVREKIVEADAVTYTFLKDQVRSDEGILERIDERNFILRGLDWAGRVGGGLSVKLGSCLQDNSGVNCFNEVSYKDLFDQENLDALTRFEEQEKKYSELHKTAGDIGSGKISLDEGLAQLKFVRDTLDRTDQFSLSLLQELDGQVDPEVAAASLLERAKDEIELNDGRIGAGKVIYRELAARYPDTRAGREAQAKLAKLDELYFDLGFTFDGSLVEKYLGKDTAGLAREGLGGLGLLDYSFDGKFRQEHAELFRDAAIQTASIEGIILPEELAPLFFKGGKAIAHTQKGARALSAISKFAKLEKISVGLKRLSTPLREIRSVLAVERAGLNELELVKFLKLDTKLDDLGIVRRASELRDRFDLVGGAYRKAIKGAEAELSAAKLTKEEQKIRVAEENLAEANRVYRLHRETIESNLLGSSILGREVSAFVLPSDIKAVNELGAAKAAYRDAYKLFKKGLKRGDADDLEFLYAAERLAKASKTVEEDVGFSNRLFAALNGQEALIKAKKAILAERSGEAVEVTKEFTDFKLLEATSEEFSSLDIQFTFDDSNNVVVYDVHNGLEEPSRWVIEKAHRDLFRDYQFEINVIDGSDISTKEGAEHIVNILAEADVPVTNKVLDRLREPDVRYVEVAEVVANNELTQALPSNSDLRDLGIDEGSLAQRQDDLVSGDPDGLARVVTGDGQLFANAELEDVILSATEPIDGSIIVRNDKKLDVITNNGDFLEVKRTQLSEGEEVSGDLIANLAQREDLVSVSIPKEAVEVGIQENKNLGELVVSQLDEVRGNKEIGLQEVVEFKGLKRRTKAHGAIREFYENAGEPLRDPSVVKASFPSRLGEESVGEKAVSLAKRETPPERGVNCNLINVGRAIIGLSGDDCLLEAITVEKDIIIARDSASADVRTGVQGTIGRISRDQSLDSLLMEVSREERLHNFPRDTTDLVSIINRKISNDEWRTEIPDDSTIAKYLEKLDKTVKENGWTGEYIELGKGISKDIVDSLSSFVEGDNLLFLLGGQARLYKRTDGSWEVVKPVFYDRVIGELERRFFTAVDTGKRHQSVELILREAFDLPAPSTKIVEIDELSYIKSPFYEDYVNLGKSGTKDSLEYFLNNQFRREAEEVVFKEWVRNNKLSPEIVEVYNQLISESPGVSFSTIFNELKTSTFFPENLLVEVEDLIFENSYRLQKEADFHTVFNLYFKASDVELGLTKVDGEWRIVRVDDEYAFQTFIFKERVSGGIFRYSLPAPGLYIDDKILKEFVVENAQILDVLRSRELAGLADEEILLRFGKDIDKIQNLVEGQALIDALLEQAGYNKLQRDLLISQFFKEFVPGNAQILGTLRGGELAGLTDEEILLRFGEHIDRIQDLVKDRSLLDALLEQAGYDQEQRRLLINQLEDVTSEDILKGLKFLNENNGKAALDREGNLITLDEYLDIYGSKKSSVNKEINDPVISKGDEPTAETVVARKTVDCNLVGNAIGCETSSKFTPALDAFGTYSNQESSAHAIESLRIQGRLKSEEVVREAFASIEDLRDVDLFHGTSSKGLPGILRKEGLSPLNNLGEGDLPPFGGELSVGIFTSGVNRAGLSTVGFANSREAIGYSRKVENLEGWNLEIGLRELEEVRRELDQARKNGDDLFISINEERLSIFQKRVDAWNSLSALERELIEEPFPIVFGFSENGLKRAPAMSSVPGEQVITNEIKFNDRKLVLFTTSEKKEELRKIVRESFGQDIPVYSLDSLDLLPRIISRTPPPKKTVHNPGVLYSQFKTDDDYVEHLIEGYKEWEKEFLSPDNSLDFSNEELEEIFSKQPFFNKLLSFFGITEPKIDAKFEKALQDFGFNEGEIKETVSILKKSSPEERKSKLDILQKRVQRRINDEKLGEDVETEYAGRNYRYSQTTGWQDASGTKVSDLETLVTLEADRLNVPEDLVRNSITKNQRQLAEEGLVPLVNPRVYEKSLEELVEAVDDGASLSEETIKQLYFYRVEQDVNDGIISPKSAESLKKIYSRLYNHFKNSVEDIGAFSHILAKKDNSFTNVHLFRDGEYTAVSELFNSHLSGSQQETRMIYVSRDTLYVDNAGSAYQLIGSLISSLNSYKDHVVFKKEFNRAISEAIRTNPDFETVALKTLAYLDGEGLLKPGKKLRFVDTCCRASITLFLEGVVNHYRPDIPTESFLMYSGTQKKILSAGLGGDSVEKLPKSVISAKTSVNTGSSASQLYDEEGVPLFQLSLDPTVAYRAGQVNNYLAELVTLELTRNHWEQAVLGN